MEKCQHCGKGTNNSIKRKIVYRTREWKTDGWGRRKFKAVVKDKTMIFCSELCAAHEQMAHEG